PFTSPHLPAFPTLRSSDLPFHSNGYPGFGKPKWIIIHGTASGIGYPAQATGRDFQKSGNSVHFIVGYDGAVVQCVDLSNAAWGKDRKSNRLNSSHEWISYA